jgi:hypothetical protein
VPKDEEDCMMHDHDRHISFLAPYKRSTSTFPPYPASPILQSRSGGANKRGTFPHVPISHLPFSPGPQTSRGILEFPLRSTVQQIYDATPHADITCATHVPFISYLRLETYILFFAFILPSGLCLAHRTESSETRLSDSGSGPRRDRRFM